MTDDGKKNPGDKHEDEESSSSAIRNPSSEAKPHPDPTRYGDWEIKGKCVDF